MFSTLAFAGFMVYMAFTAKELYTLFYPPGCKHGRGQGSQCFRAELPLRARIDITAHVGGDGGGGRVAVWNATNVSSYEEIEDTLTIPVPPGMRRGEMRELWLTFELSRAGQNEVLSAARVNLVTMYAPRERSQATMLLERDVFASPDDEGAPQLTEARGGAVGAAVSSELAPPDTRGRVAHFIYSARMCELRLVTDATPYGPPNPVPYLAPDGIPIGQAWDSFERTYSPHFYVDRFSLLRKHSAPLSSNLEKPHPRMRLKFKPISLGRHRIMTQMENLFKSAGTVFGLGDGNCHAALQPARTHA